MADTTLIKIREGIIIVELVTSTKEAAKVASEDELTDTSEGALTCRTVLSSKGSPHTRVICSSSNQKMEKQKTMLVRLHSPLSAKAKQKGCAAFFRDLLKEETELLFKSDKREKPFKDIKICTKHQNKKSLLHSSTIKREELFSNDHFLRNVLD